MSQPALVRAVIIEGAPTLLDPQPCKLLHTHSLSPKLYRIHTSSLVRTLNILICFVVQQMPGDGSQVKQPEIPLSFFLISVNSTRGNCRRSLCQNYADACWWQFLCECCYTLPAMCTCATRLSCMGGRSICPPWQPEWTDGARGSGHLSVGLPICQRRVTVAATGNGWCIIPPTRWSVDSRQIVLSLFIFYGHSWKSVSPLQCSSCHTDLRAFRQRDFVALFKLAGQTFGDKEPQVPRQEARRLDERKIRDHFYVGFVWFFLFFSRKYTQSLFPLNYLNVTYNDLFLSTTLHAYT